MSLLFLPDELLDIAFKALLPPFRSQSLAETFVFTVPVDLLNLRLVSRRFHRLATPLAWRRAQLQIASPTVFDSSRSPLGRKQDPHRSLTRCRFFHAHPDLAAHVRVLLLSLEWQSDCTDLARSALRAATQAMTSLRTVLLWDADVLAVRDIQQLLQRPLLRAVCLMDLKGGAMTDQDQEWGAGEGLKMLHIANSVCPARLIRGARESLECVSIELAKRDEQHGEAGEMGQGGKKVEQPTLRDMPWGTLREVALVDCVDEEDWYCFLDGFKRYKSLSLFSPLTELMIGDLSGLDPTRLTSLLHTFSLQPLTRLTLFNLPLLDPPTLTLIVKSFPALTHLTLLTEGELVPWPYTIDAYARPLAQLHALECLAWNNFCLESVHAESCFLNMCEESLGMLYERAVRAVVKRVKGLKEVKFVSMTDCVVDTVVVTKKGTGTGMGKGRRGGPTFGDLMRGEEMGRVRVWRSTEAALHTSSWSTRSGAFEDI